MSDYPEHPSEKQRVEALQLLKTRVARLQRLIQLEAPDVILINETRLVDQAAEMLNPHAYHAERARDANLRTRRRLGICTEPGCEGDAAKGHELCAKHQSEAEADEQELIEEDEDVS